jgi:hypothetical protein
MLLEAAMKTIVEFRGYRTRVAYDDQARSFVHKTANPELEMLKPAGATVVERPATAKPVKPRRAPRPNPARGA